jgi:hypothetical protein
VFRCRKWPTVGGGEPQERAGTPIRTQSAASHFPHSLSKPSLHSSQTSSARTSSVNLWHLLQHAVTIEFTRYVPNRRAKGISTYRTPSLKGVFCDPCHAAFGYASYTHWPTPARLGAFLRRGRSASLPTVRPERAPLCPFLCPPPAEKRGSGLRVHLVWQGSPSPLGP